MRWRNWLLLVVILMVEFLLITAHPLLSENGLLRLLLFLSVEVAFLAFLGWLLPNLVILFCGMFLLYAGRLWLLVDNAVEWDVRGEPSDLAVLSLVGFFISYLIASQFHLHFKARKSPPAENRVT